MYFQGRGSVAEEVGGLRVLGMRVRGWMVELRFSLCLREIHRAQEFGATFGRALVDPPPHPVLVTMRDNNTNIRGLVYSKCTRLNPKPYYRVGEREGCPMESLGRGSK